MEAGAEHVSSIFIGCIKAILKALRPRPLHSDNKHTDCQMSGATLELKRDDDTLTANSVWLKLFTILIVPL